MGFGTEDIYAVARFTAALVAAYAALKVALPTATRTQRSWYLTAISSAVTSAFGLLTLFAVLAHGLESEFAREETPTDRALCHFFIAYCLADLGTAQVEYAELLDWQAGWTHHLFYAFSLVLLLARGQSPFFVAGLVEELPTVVLAATRLGYSGMSLKWPFAVLYFLLRIVYHTAATFVALHHSTLAFAMGLVVLRQHLWWFGGWWRGATENAHHAGPQEGRSDAAKTKKSQEAQLTLNQKLILLGTMVLCQIATMLHATMAGYRKRDWTNATAGAALLVAAWLYFTFQSIAIFVDTYTVGFIALAISERKVIYNISWEDPRVEREALKLGCEDVVLTISSAGCNVLDYLLEKPKHIVAADLNEAQLAVLDLKLACIATQMPHSEFFALWGRSDPRVFERRYASSLRAALDRDASREYWDATKASLFRENWMFAGTSGLMAYILSVFIARPLGIAGALQRNLDAEAAAHAIFQKVLQPAMKLVCQPRVWTWAAPLGGIPPEQLALVERRPMLFSDRLEEIVKRRMWSADNYFYHGYCTGTFDAFPKCPRYMSPHFYQQLLTDLPTPAAIKAKVTLWHGSWGDARIPEGTDGFTFVSLLDSMDWMPPQLVAELISQLVRRVDRKAKHRIFWRSYAPGPSLQKSQYDLFTVHSPTLAHLRPRELPIDDRVGWYLSQWVCDAIPADFDADSLEPLGSGAAFSNSVVDDLRVCVAMGAHALRKDKDVAAFYANQASRYDGFREVLLPGRDVLLKYAVPWALLAKTKNKYALVCVGCGTARDLEFISQHLLAVCQSSGKRVALLDLSPELLAVASQRVDRLGLSSCVDLVCGDVTKPNQLPAGLVGGADVVTCSFCLTMIPKWKQALDALVGLVAPGGYLAVVDFTERFDQSGSALETVYKKWFALDGVYFQRAQVDALAKAVTPTFYAEARSRCPYTPWYPTRYTFVGRKA